MTSALRPVQRAAIRQTFLFLRGASTKKMARIVQSTIPGYSPIWLGRRTRILPRRQMQGGCYNQDMHILCQSQSLTPVTLFPLSSLTLLYISYFFLLISVLFCLHPPYSVSHLLSFCNNISRCCSLSLSVCVFFCMSVSVCLRRSLSVTVWLYVCL